jgi:hypothetical protein
MRSNSFRSQVADGQADNLGRKSPGHAEIEEVLVLGDQYENLLTGPFPDRGVTGAAETDLWRPWVECGNLSISSGSNRS